jgi:superfamily II RNA helicase
MSTYLKIADVKAGPQDMPVDPPIHYKFPLDPFQQHAMKAICAEENVLVTAKTGSGKTLVGEIQIAYSLRKGGRVFYTTPIKSLSNQKFNDLKKQFGSVGVMTGDIKFCPDADVVIMTTEILRNLLFKKDSSTATIGITGAMTCDGLDAVIFDECHYINDKARGHVWEEIMILLPPDVKMVMLSATLDHPEYFAEWLGELKKRPINLISTEYRIVPLTHTLWYDNQFHTLMDSKNTYNEKTYKDWLSWRLNKEKSHEKFQLAVKEAKAAGVEGGIEGKVRPTKFLHQMNELIKTLDSKELLPALFFVLSRKDCERYAQKVEVELITSSDRADAIHIWNFHLRHHQETLQRLPQYHTLRNLIERGIAFHHSGLVPMLKEIIEILFSKGFIKILFATETFAVGINMPTKTAVFVGVKKYDEERDTMRVLTSAEYIQMAGRAGRRGLDTMGTVIYLPDKDPIEPSEMRAMMGGARAPVTSRMEFGYDFILKTIHSGNHTWLDILEKSYWSRQRAVQIAENEKERFQKMTRLQQIKLSQEENDAMVQKESLESARLTFTNAKKKKVELELQKWNDKHRGMIWQGVASRFKEIGEINMAIKLLDDELRQLKSATNGVERKISILENLGYLKAIGNPRAHTKDTMTLQGVLATELNEADPLLISKFYMSKESKALSELDLLLVLSACIVDGKEKSVPLGDVKVSQAVKDSLYSIDETWQEVCEVEIQHAAKQSEWKLGTSWIDPMREWIEGTPVGSICETYGIYEGNLIRAVLKLHGLLEEWRSMALYSEHIDVLDRLRDTHTLLLRESVIQDSLYLHM